MASNGQQGLIGGSSLTLLQRAKQARTAAAQALRVSPPPPAPVSTAQRGAQPAPATTPKSAVSTPASPISSSPDDLLALTREFYAGLYPPS